MLGVEVLREWLSPHSFNLGLGWLGSVYEFEWFIFLLVSSFELKWLRSIVVNSKQSLILGRWLPESWGSSPHLSEHLVLLLQLLNLFFCKVLLVVAVALERKWVIGELGLLFMINIFHSILPMRKLSLIRTPADHRSFILFRSFNFFFSRFDLIRLINSFVSSSFLHLMGIYNFVFLFMIKCIFLSNDFSLT
jgi:hypothetical protein